MKGRKDFGGVVSKFERMQSITMEKAWWWEQEATVHEHETALHLQSGIEQDECWCSTRFLSLSPSVWGPCHRMVPLKFRVDRLFLVELF